MKNDIRFMVTNKCNYNCYFCHNEGIGECLNNNELSVDNYVNLYKCYKDICDWNGVTISGGEPLTYNDFYRLCEALYNEGAKITTVTNGVLYGC